MRRLTQFACLVLLVHVLPGVVGAEDADAFVLFDNNNPAAVQNGPTQPTVFETKAPCHLVSIMTYHWNGGRGERSGSIALVSEAGQQLGPWPAQKETRPDGKPPLYWTCLPNVQLPAGRWTVVDAAPWSWAANERSGHAGIATLHAMRWVDPPQVRAEAAIEKDAARALQHLDARIAAHPDDAEAHRLRAVAHGTLAGADASGKHARLQRRDLDRVIALRPRDHQPLVASAWARFLQADPDGAIEDYQAAAAVAPDDPARHRELASALLSSGRRGAAAEAYGRALALAAADPATLLAQGALLEELGQTSAAAKGYRYLLAILPHGYAREDALTRLAALGLDSSPASSPPATPPATAPATTPAPDDGASPAPVAGQVLVQGTVDARGGRVGAQGGITLDFPAGALDGAAEVVVRAGTEAGGGSRIVHVDVHGARTRLGVPVRVTLPMQRGLDQARVHPAMQVGNRLWIELPGAYDPAAGMLVFETPHFSTLGGLVEDTGNLKWAIGSGLVAVAVVGGGWCIAGSAAALYAGAAGMTIAETAVVTVATFFFGKLIGDAVYDETRAKLLGLDTVLAVPGFRILYTDDASNTNAVASGDWGTAMFAKEGGAFAGFAKGKAEASAFANGDLYEYVHLPWPVVELAFELMLTRSYYAKAGYEVRPLTWVYVYSIPAGSEGTSYGSWEAAADEKLGGVLNVNAKLLDAAHADPRQAMVAHESWHAIAKANGLAGAHAAWVDEAVAWALEGTVFEDNYGFLKDRGWSMAREELQRGLTLDDDEDEVKRGTFLWPFARFLLHHGGHAEIRDLVSGKLGNSKDLLQAQFRTFVRSLLAEEHCLADTYEQDPPVTTRDGKPISIPSGWQPPTANRPGLDLNELGSIVIRPGVVRVPKMLQAPRPLSFAVFRAAITSTPPPASGETPPLVFRRATPTLAEEYAVLKPTEGRADTVSRPRPDDELRIEREVVVAPGSWLQRKGGKGFALPVAVLGVKTEDRDPASDLLLYWLDAPRFDRAEPLPDNPLWTRVHYLAPQPALGGKGLSVRDCYQEIRLVGIDKTGQAHVLMSAPQDFPLDPEGGKGYVDISHEETRDYAELGFLAIDKVAKGEDGAGLASPIRRFDNPAVRDADYPVVGVDANLRFYFRVTGTLKESGSRSESALEFEHELKETEWNGRRHTETWVDHGMRIGWEIRMAPGDESLESLTLTMNRDNPNQKADQRFTLRDVPQVAVADLGPEGPVIRLFGLRGANLVAHLSEMRSVGSGGFDERDDSEHGSKRVSYATKLEEMKAEDCQVVVALVSMTLAQLRAKADAGKVDKEKLERRYQEAMAKVNKALQAMPTEVESGR